MPEPLKIDDYSAEFEPTPDAPHTYYDETLKRTVVKVLPGTQYVSTGKGELLSTVLGSCVSACLWDPYLGLGGMNHFMLPFDETGDWSGKSSALRYGNHAMLALVNSMADAGANRHRLRNKMFGGANVLNGAGDVGGRNTRFAEDYIAKQQVMTVLVDLGGDRGRRIVFDPETGKVWRKFLSPTANDSVTRAEAGLRHRLLSQFDFYRSE